MSSANVNGRRWLLWMGAIFAVEQAVSLTWWLTRNMADLPWWVFAAGCAMAAGWVYMLAIAFVSPCPWEMERIMRRKLGDALNEVRTVTALAHYFRDMSARAGVRYDLVETEDGLTATARFPGEE